MINLWIIPLIFFVANHADALKDKSEYLVEGLGEIVPAFEEFDGEMYAGMIPIHSSSDAPRQGEIMFWLFAPTQPQVEKSMVMWLNGGKLKKSQLVCMKADW
jgi:hypothetical protein